MSSIRAARSKYSMKSVQYLSKFSAVLLHGAALGPSRRVPPALGTTVRLQHQPCRWCSAAGEAWVELVTDAEAAEYRLWGALDTLHEYLWQHDPRSTRASSG